MKICGIDPSIKSTGKVIMELDDETLDVKSIQFYGYTSTKIYAITDGNVQIEHVGTDYADKSLQERQRIAYDIIMRDMDEVSYVGIEDFAYSKANGGASGQMVQIAEFCGGLRYLLYMKGIGLMDYGIQQIKRYATGSGTADKVGMCSSFKELFPELYPEQAFSKLKQYESPMADLCDAFWMCEILRMHLKLDKFGPEALPEVQLALLTTTVTRGAMSLSDTPLVKLGVPYEKVKKKRKKKKAK